MSNHFMYLGLQTNIKFIAFIVFQIPNQVSLNACKKSPSKPFLTIIWVAHTFYNRISLTLYSTHSSGGRRLVACEFFLKPFTQHLFSAVSTSDNFELFVF